MGFNSGFKGLMLNRYKAVHGYVNAVKLDLSHTRLGNVAISATNLKIHFSMRSQFFLIWTYFCCTILSWT